MEQVNEIEKKMNEIDARIKMEKVLCEPLVNRFNDGIEINKLTINVIDYYLSLFKLKETPPKNTKVFLDCTIFDNIKKASNQGNEIATNAYNTISFCQDSEFKIDVADSLLGYWESLLGVLFKLNDYIIEYSKQPDYDKRIYEHYKEFIRAAGKVYDEYGNFIDSIRYW